MDSTLLLYALYRLRRSGSLSTPLAAIHIHHGLQQEADLWQQQCQQYCDQLTIPLHSYRVDATPATGQSPEATARRVRYQVFEQQLVAGDQLLTAHHQEDQAETFLLRALRGSGPKGLASMRSIRPLGEGELLRPLLDYSRDALREYAREKQLQWVEDPSNQQLDAARNYIRHEILPRLRQRWPAVTTTLSRSAAHCGEADRLIEQWGRDQLSGLRVGDPLPLLENESDEERKARIRCWLSMNRIEPPNHRHLHAILDEVVVAREDATPELVWVDQHGVRVQLSRYRQALYLREKADSRLLTSEARWNMEQPLPLTTRTELRAQPSLGCGLRAESVREGRVTVNWRSGGERCQPVGAKMRRTVKNLLREVGVPPWQRAEIPLLFIDGVLAQVVGYFVCAPYAVKVGEWGVSVEVVERQL